MSLTAGQYELDGWVFGAGTPYHLAPGGVDFGTAEVQVEDTAVGYGDGNVFGVDSLRGRSIQFTFQVYVDSQANRDVVALDTATALAVKWRGDDARRTPGKVLPLRMCLAGDRTRVVYGRPRRVASTVRRAQYDGGWVPMVAAFNTIDDLFYVDSPAILVLQQYSAPTDTGLSGPWQDPLGDSGVSTAPRPGFIEAGGSVDTRWIEITFEGPSVNPTCEIVGVGSVTWRGSLSAYDVARLQVHPSLRSFTLNGSGSLFGGLRGTPLDDFVLPPGRQEIRYTAIDATNTSKMTVIARGAHPHP